MFDDLPRLSDLGQRLGGQLDSGLKPRHGDDVVGRVTSGGYGYAVGASIAYAYVPGAVAEPGTAVAIDFFGDWVAGEVRADPLYDPTGERIRA